MDYVDTICWSCANATGMCNWSSKLEPVEGWTAIEKPIVVGKEKTKPSYKVIDCPEFREG